MPAEPTEPAAPTGHLSRELLDRFFAGSITVDELGERAVGHLAARCGECRRRLGSRDWRATFRRGAERAVDVLERVAEEREALSAHLGELLHLDEEEVRWRVAGDERFATLGFVEHQMEVAWAAFSMGDDEITAEAGWLALLALRRLRPEVYGKATLARYGAERYLLEARRLARLASDPGEARDHWNAGRRLAREAAEPPDLMILAYLAGAETRFRAGRSVQARRFACAAGRLAADEPIAGKEAPVWLWHAHRLASSSDRLAGRPRRVVRRIGHLFLAEPPAGALEWAVAREWLFADAESGGASRAAARLEAWISRAKREGVAADPNRVAQIGLATGGLARRRRHFDKAVQALDEALDAALRYAGFDEVALGLVELAHCHEALGQGEALRDRLVPLQRWRSLAGSTPVALHGLARLVADLSLRGGKTMDVDTLERALVLGEPKLRQRAGDA